MKKRAIAFLIVFCLSLINSDVFAEDTGIIMIGGHESESTSVSMDDFKVGDLVRIDGFGEVKLTDAGWYGKIEKYDKNTYLTTYQGPHWVQIEYYDAGSEAVYYRLQFDILNIQKDPVVYFDEFSDIICTYDDNYQFGGWVRQHVTSRADGYEDYPLVTLNDVSGGWPIGTMYRGQYSVVITLPIDVMNNVTSKSDPKPLSISMKIGESDFTYIYRK